MGIQGLLPLLKSIMAPIHVEELRGQTVAVDAYSWLHKGAFSCATQLCKGLPTSKHVDYCMHRVNLLLHHGIKPILVFDGGIMPMKLEQETKRSRARKENLARAVEHEAMGNSSAAFECYQKAVDISPTIAHELIQVLKQEKVDYIVAPYEADAQMTFLSINNLVDAVITEDSDLIPFGCSRIIFKMDKFGQGVEFQCSKLGKNKDLDLTGFSKQMLLEMCIFSGCDYLPSLPGMGLKRAHALVKRLKSYENVIKHLKYSAVSVPPSFEEMFRKAIWAFQYQRVYDPAKEDIVHLSDIPHGFYEDLDFLGPWLPQDVAKRVAQGDIDPITKIPFQGEDTHSPLMLDRSCPMPSNGKKRLVLPVQKNLLTNYFCLASLEARRKFRAPKIMTKDPLSADSSSPSSENFNSESRGAAEDATCIINNIRGASVGFCNVDDSVFVKEHTTDTATVSMEDKFSNHGRKVDRLHLHDRPTDQQHSSPLPEPKYEACKPFLALHKEYGSKHKLALFDITTEPTNKKVVVRSSYFSKKLPDDDDHEKQNAESCEEKEKKSCISGDQPVSNGLLPRNNYLKSAIKKRKPFEVNGKQMEDLPLKNARITPVCFGEDNQTHDLNNKGTEMKKEEKFCCDISHLNSYADIAEKSMENFTAIISSFRYTSSGSRASGLRAPLKDIQNTSSTSDILSTRPKLAPIDINKFSYSSKR